MEIAIGAAEGSLWGLVTWVDACIILIALISAVVGFWSGFVWQVIRIGALLVAFWIAAHLHESASGPLTALTTKNMANMIAFAIVFLVVLLGLHLAMFLARGPINAIRPEMVDHVLGVMVGFIKGLLICGILALLILKYCPKSSDLRRHIHAAPVAQAMAWCARGLSVLMTGS